MGNGCGLQMDGFSAHCEPSESISVDVYYFGDFAIVSGGLSLFPEEPRTLRGCRECPGTPGGFATSPGWVRGGSAPLRTSRGPMVGVEAL